MEWAAVGVLLLSGFCSLSSSSDQDAFLFIPQNKTWLEAQTYCRQNYVDLSIIRDEGDLVTLSGLVDSSDDFVFVGLQRIWAWSALDSKDIRERKITFSNFENGEPNSENDCGLIRPTGEWASASCSSTDLPFFCYDASTTNISLTFVLVNISKNWGQARHYCRTTFTDLARIRSMEENQFLLSLYSNGTAWIGLTQRQWVWSDGSFTAFVPWVPQNPDLSLGLCAALNISGDPIGVVPRDCSDTLPFFCYNVQQKMYTVKIRMSVKDSAVNVADALSNSLIKTVQTKLNSQGFSEDVQLTWSKHPKKVLPAPTPPQPLCPVEITPT